MNAANSDIEWTEQRAKQFENAKVPVLRLARVRRDAPLARYEAQFALKYYKPVIAVHLYETHLPGGLDL